MIRPPILLVLLMSVPGSIGGRRKRIAVLILGRFRRLAAAAVFTVLSLPPLAIGRRERIDILVLRGFRRLLSVLHLRRLSLVVPV